MEAWLNLYLIDSARTALDKQSDTCGILYCTYLLTGDSDVRAGTAPTH